MVTMEEAVRRVNELDSFYKFFCQHPQYGCEANQKILKDFHGQQEVSLVSLEGCLQIPSIRNALAVVSVERQVDNIHDHAEQERLTAAARQQSEAQDAARAEVVRKEEEERAVIAEANERERLLREVAAFWSSDRDMQARLIKGKFCYWSTDDLRREAESRRLARASRNLSAEEFAKQQGFTEPRQKSNPTSLTLPEFVTRQEIGAWTAKEMRKFIRGYVVKGYTERIVNAAITSRVRGEN